jgi:hypothetical protein
MHQSYALMLRTYILLCLNAVCALLLLIQDARRITLQMAKDYEDALCNRLEILAKELPNETKVKYNYTTTLCISSC